MGAKTIHSQSRDCHMSSHGKTRLLIMVTAIAALAAGISAYSGGGSSAQYGHNRSGQGYISMEVMPDVISS